MTINNSIILSYLFFFIITWFFTHLFIKAGSFFRVCIFFLSFAIFIPLEQLDSIPLTLASFFGAITAYFGGVGGAFSSVKDIVIDSYYIVKDIFSGVFSFFSFITLKLRQVIFFIISIFKKIKSSQNKKTSSSSNKQRAGNNKKNHRGYEEQKQRAKEQFKKAREEAKKREEESQDNRSFEDIVGVNPEYTKDDLKNAYKRASSKFHPDKYSHMSEAFRLEAEQEFKKIQKAYKMLSGRLK